MNSESQFPGPNYAYILDGGEAVQFLVRIKQRIENPEQLLLEG